MYSNELISPLLHSGPIILEILLDRKDCLPASSKIAVFRLFSTILFLIGGLPIFSVPLLSHTLVEPDALDLALVDAVAVAHVITGC